MKEFRCPTCNHLIIVPDYVDDYVHKNCATKWRIFGDRRAVFKDELLNKGHLLTGMKSTPLKKRKGSPCIDKTEIGDSYFRV